MFQEYTRNTSPDYKLWKNNFRCHHGNEELCRFSFPPSTTLKTPSFVSIAPSIMSKNKHLNRVCELHLPWCTSVSIIQLAEKNDEYFTRGWVQILQLRLTDTFPSSAFVRIPQVNKIKAWKVNFMAATCLCAERDVPVSPVHALRDEVQPDVQGQPDCADPGGGSAEHLISWRERSLTNSCC